MGKCLSITKLVQPSYKITAEKSGLDAFFHFFQLQYGGLSKLNVLTWAAHCLFKLSVFATDLPKVEETTFPKKPLQPNEMIEHE